VPSPKSTAAFRLAIISYIIGLITGLWDYGNSEFCTQTAENM